MSKDTPAARTRLRAVVASLGALLVLLAVGCGGSGDSATGGGSDGGGGGSLADNPAVVTEVTLGTVDDLRDITALCGEDEVTIALADGFGGNSWRRAMRAEFEDEASKCPNVRTTYTDAAGNPQKAISDIEGLAAKGVDGLITYADSGEAVLPAIRRATRSGTMVVPFGASIGGAPGSDYVTGVSQALDATIPTKFGELYAEWMVEALDGKGNVVQLGGTPGNAFSDAVTAGIKNVFERNPGMKLLEGPVTTNWDVGRCQKVTAGLLTKYDKIDGVIADYGACAVAAMRAFEAANRPLVPFTGDDQNALACAWEQKAEANPGLQVAIAESRPWGSRLALRRALAAVEGKQWDEPTDVLPRLVGDSIAGGDEAPMCDPKLPPDAFTNSSQLSEEQILQLFGD